MVAVAFARRRREPRSVDLDLASSIGPDRSRRAQFAHQERYRRSPHTEYLRQRLLGDREDVVVDAVAKIEQPACHARFDRMQRIAGHAELKLYQYRPDVNLDCVPDRRAPVESGVKSRRGDPGGGARRTNDGGNGRRRRPQHGKQAYRALAPDCGGGNRLSRSPCRSSARWRRLREEDMLDLVTRSRKDRVLIERDRLQLGHQQIEVRCRQRCQKAVTFPPGRITAGNPRRGPGLLDLKCRGTAALT